MTPLLNFVIVLSVICSQHGSIGGNPSKISESVRSLLEKGDRVNIVVSFNGGIQPALDRARAQRHTDPKLEIQAIVEATKDHAAKSQAGVISTLSSRSAGTHFKYFKQYWVGNKLFVKEADADTVKIIAEDSKVAKITLEPVAEIPEGWAKKRTAYELPKSVSRPLWSIERIQVQQAWKELGGRKGDGVIVGVIDSGARHTHEALRDNFVGLKYGWYDAVGKRPDPYDNDGHGTHVTGILVGGEGIGVAPNAKWMSCNVFNGTNFPGEKLLDCIQWMACPTLSDGTNPDCSKAPAIVSNSWVVPRGSDDFNDGILHWRAMGIIPIFAVGNSGPECNTTRAPGELPFVIGVGASDKQDAYLYFSSAGLASDGNIKPELVAPGEYVWSASSYGDSKYHEESGTSMATPHVSGVVALLKVRNPALTFDEANDLLTQNTFPMSPLNWTALDEMAIEPSFFCNGGIDTQQTPNIFSGYGRVDAFKAVQAQTRLIKNKMS